LGLWRWKLYTNKNRVNAFPQGGYVFKGEQCYKIVLRGKDMQINLLLKKGWAVGIILLFVAIVFIPTYSAQVNTPQINEQKSPQESPAFKGGHADSFQGVDMVIIWGTFEEKIHKFPVFSLEIRNRDPWDNRTINVFGFFKEGTQFHLYLIKSYWVACVPLRSVHLGVVGQNQLFVVASGRIIIYQ
jgi:hypothetical protein